MGRALRHCPAAALGDGLDRLSKSGDTGVTNLIAAKSKFLALQQRPHDVLSLESDPARLAGCFERWGLLASDASCE